MAMLEVERLYKSFGGVKAIQDFSIRVESGEIHGIIGPNGAGKTTIFNVVSGVYPSDAGKVTLDGRDVTRMEQHQIALLGIGRTFQNIRLFRGLSVLDNVMCAYDPRSKYGVTGSLLPTRARISEEKRGREYCMGFLRTVGLEAYAHAKPENISYCHRRRLEIARALACQPKVLLLDEPAAGLNPMEVTELTVLIRRLSRDFGFAILLIEHRLELVMQVSRLIHVQNFGKTIAVGTPAQVRGDPQVIEAYLGKEEG